MKVPEILERSNLQDPRSLWEKGMSRCQLWKLTASADSPATLWEFCKGFSTSTRQTFFPLTPKQLLDLPAGLGGGELIHYVQRCLVICVPDIHVHTSLGHTATRECISGILLGISSLVLPTTQADAFMSQI